ncbi:hypothetical protein PIB30_108406, partial [Stylosanthes scabra]|nr:hypothetical protein [Stylosanthes scabra]
TSLRCGLALREAARGGGSTAWVWFPPISTLRCFRMMRTPTLLVDLPTLERGLSCLTGRFHSWQRLMLGGLLPWSLLCRSSLRRSPSCGRPTRTCTASSRRWGAADRPLRHCQTSLHRHHRPHHRRLMPRVLAPPMPMMTQTMF